MEARDGSELLSDGTVSLSTKEKELGEFSWDPGSPRGGVDELDMVEDLLATTVLTDGISWAEHTQRKMGCSFHKSWA